MKLVTFTHEGKTRPGVVCNGLVVDVNLVVANPCATLADTLALSDGALHELSGRAYALADREGERAASISDITLEAPLQRPGKIICVGLNYRDHAAEQGKEPPTSPMIFAKYASAITRHRAPIVLPPNSVEVDYEAELCVVIGKPGRNIALDDAMTHVAGYTIINDVSARDMQRADKQFTRAKSCDTFAPLGPWIVLKDEISDPHALAVSLTLNGQTMQASNTDQLIFNIPHLIWHLSQSMTLETGDLIATGTPGGVGVFRQPPVFLKPGDEVSVTIEGIGTLTNHVVAFDASPHPTETQAQ
jgi:2-keto-4-pentenoate hydratase/2-oxohepta-3-ene-1,7-dioic acid hydratase in catechol pathway